VKWASHPPLFTIGRPNTGCGCIRCAETKNRGRGAFAPQKDVRRSGVG